MKGFVLVTHVLPPRSPLDSTEVDNVQKVLDQSYYVSVADMVACRKITNKEFVHKHLCKCLDDVCTVSPFYEIVVKNRFQHEILP